MYKLHFSKVVGFPKSGHIIILRQSENHICMLAASTHVSRLIGQAIKKPMYMQMLESYTCT